MCTVEEVFVRLIWRCCRSNMKINCWGIRQRRWWEQPCCLAWKQVARRERQEAELEMLRFTLGVVRMDHEWSEEQLMLDVLEKKSERADGGGSDMFRGETENVWVERCWGWSCPAGRPKRRHMAVVREEEKFEEAKDRLRWRQMIRCGHP